MRQSPQEGIRPAVAPGALCLLFNLFSCNLVCQGKEGAGGFQEQRPLVAIAFPSAACRVGEPPLGL